MASDRLFALPALLSWLLQVVALAFLVAFVTLNVEALRVLWALPTALLLLNFTIFASTVALQQRAWRRRAPFEWQFTLLVGVHSNHIRRSRRDAAPAEVLEERVMAASRGLERLLRNRYEPQPVGASNTIAAHTWAVRLRPVLEARAQRLLAPDGMPPAVWFTDWVDSAAAVVLSAAPLPADVLGQHVATARQDPFPRIPVAGLWALTAGTAAVGVLTSPVAAGAFLEADWKLIGSIAAVAVAAVTCANFALGWFRRTSARTG